MDIASIRSFIQSEVLDNESVNIGDDDDLLLSGFLDSHSIMRLAAHIEEAVGITIPPEDVTTDNFSSLRQIDSYLTTRRGNTGAAGPPN